MIFVIPMAGKGQRFVDGGFDVPKMLIRAKGKTLLEWSIDSLPLDLCTRLIFIGLSEHKSKFSVDSFIESKYGSVCPVMQIYIDSVTRGQAETVLIAKDSIPTESPLLIFNIDTAFQSTTLRNNLLDHSHDGILGSFCSQAPQFSYARTDSEHFIVEVAEKKVISPNALTGLYHFQKAVWFFDAAEKAISNKETVNNEFYIAPLYNRLIEKGKKFRLDKVESFDILGTPQELELFLQK